MNKILTQAQIKQKIKVVKKAPPLESVSALADIYYAFVLRRYKRFKEYLRDNPEALSKKRIKACHERVKFYAKELDKLVAVTKRLRDLEKKAVRAKKGKFIAAKVRKQADEAEKICKLYGREVKKLF